MKPYTNKNGNITVITSNNFTFEQTYIGRVEQTEEGYIPMNTLDVPLSKTARPLDQAESIVLNNHLNPSI